MLNVWSLSFVCEIKELEVQQFIEKRCKSRVQEEQLYLVEQGARSATINMQIAVAINRVQAFRRDYFSALRNVWYVHK